MCVFVYYQHHYSLNWLAQLTAFLLNLVKTEGGENLQAQQTQSRDISCKMYFCPWDTAAHPHTITTSLTYNTWSRWVFCYFKSNTWPSQEENHESNKFSYFWWNGRQQKRKVGSGGGCGVGMLHAQNLIVNSVVNHNDKNKISKSMEIKFNRIRDVC